MIMSAMRAIYYHSGTAVFGALPLFYRLILGICSKGRSHSLRTRAIFCIIDQLKSSNRNTYVMCAIHGTRFSESAYDAIQLRIGHVRQSVAVDTVTVFVFSLCNVVVIVVAFAFVSIYCMHNYNELTNVVAVVIFIVAFFGAFIIMRIIVYACDVTVGTMYLCVRK